MAVLALWPKTSDTDTLYARGCSYIDLLIYWKIFSCSQWLEGDKKANIDRDDGDNERPLISSVFMDGKP